MFVPTFLINDVFKLSKIFKCFKGSDFDDGLQHLDILLLRSKRPVISALRCTEIMKKNTFSTGLSPKKSLSRHKSHNTGCNVE